MLAGYNGSQKCKDFLRAFFGHKIAGVCLLGGGGGLKRWDEPKADKKNAVRSRVLCNNYLERRFFSVPSFFVLHCRINILFRMEIRVQSSIIGV